MFFVQKKTKQIPVPFFLLFQVLQSSCSLGQQIYRRNFGTKWHAPGKGRLKSVEGQTKIKKDSNSDGYKQFSHISETAATDSIQALIKLGQEASMPQARTGSFVKNFPKTSLKTLRLRVPFPMGFSLIRFDGNQNEKSQAVTKEGNPRTEGFSVASLLLGILGWLVPFVGPTFVFNGPNLWLCWHD